MTNIVPFGKYKDRPVEDMLADANYIEWLQGQPWFAEKYTNIYNIIHSAGGEPEETPEHNALQAQFLNDDFIYRIFGNRLKPDRCTKLIRGFELHNWDVFIQWSTEHWSNGKVRECRSLREFNSGDLDKDYAKEMLNKRLSENYNYYYPSNYGNYNDWLNLPDNEHTLSLPAVSKQIEMCALFVEIKPTVGDDYPAILRQMTRNRKPVGSTETYHILYTREINTKFVAEEDVVKIFKASGFHVIVDPS